MGHVLFRFSDGTLKGHARESMVSMSSNIDFDDDYTGKLLVCLVVVVAVAIVVVGVTAIVVIILIYTFDRENKINVLGFVSNCLCLEYRV